MKLTRKLSAQDLKHGPSHSVDGEDNVRFKRKPAMIPTIPAKIAKVNEKPGSPFRYFRLFIMSYWRVIIGIKY